MLSSRKIKNVESALESLRQEENVTVEGMVCHVGKDEDRKNLIKEVSLYITFFVSVVAHNICL